MTMTHEIETKVLDIDQKEVEKRLLEVGATKISSLRLTVDWYRIKGVGEGEDPWFLRVRSNTSGVHEVTWKARSDILGTARKHKEINFTVNDPTSIADLLGELGLESYAHQEKDRTTYVFKEWQFDIDQYPGMPALIEIEGVSEDHVNEARTLLRLLEHTTWAQGERILIQEVYGLDWYDMRF